MGTQFLVVLYAGDALVAQKAALAAFDRVEELEDIMSDYREQSEIMRLCRVAVGTPQVVTPELFFVLEKALHTSEQSRGAFDVTIGPVTQLWREARRKKQLPDPAALKKARQLVGYTNVILDRDARTVTLKIPNMRIDLGGIGKGYAADEALAVLKAQGFTMALVQAGGEVVAGAAPPGKAGWQIAVRKLDPADSEAPGHLILHDRGVSTSGDEFQYLEINGQRYSHIINPADGMGLKNSPEVTIVARDGITADALATALDIMPVPEGLKLVESIEGASAVITRRGPGGFQHFYSRGFPKVPGGAAQKTETPRSQRNLRNEH
jgi:thiamine biosynthesis lipoprotein